MKRGISSGFPNAKSRHHMNFFGWGRGTAACPPEAGSFCANWHKTPVSIFPRAPVYQRLVCLLAGPRVDISGTVMPRACLTRYVSAGSFRLGTEQRLIRSGESLIEAAKMGSGRPIYIVQIFNSRELSVSAASITHGNVKGSWGRLSSLPALQCLMAGWKACPTREKSAPKNRMLTNSALADLTLR